MTPVSRSCLRVAVSLSVFAAAPLAAQRAADVKPVWPDEGSFKWAPRPTVADITANDLRTRLYGFADDSMQGRRIGEPGNYKGTAYIASEFKRLGLKPAGDSGTYFQDLPYGPIGIDSVAAVLSVGSAPLARKSEWIPTAPTNTNGMAAVTDLRNVPAVFAGRLRDETVTLDTAVFRGKIAVFLGGPPAAGGRGGGGGAGGARGGGRGIQSCDALPDRFGAAAAVIADSITAAGRGGRGGRGAGGRGAGGRGAGGAGTDTTQDNRARDAGAVAVLTIALDSMPQNAINSAFAIRNGMKPATAPGADAALAGATISRAAAAKIFGRPADQLTVGAAGQPMSAHWTFEFKMSKTPARNVIAILPGSDPARANEYVLVSAHNDHNGVNPTAVDHDSLRAVNFVTRRQGANDPACRPTPAQQHTIDSLVARARSIRPPRRDSVMNGADDDGSGTVVMLEIAEKFASEHPARSIIFVSHEGEEAGLLGSKWFTDHPTIPLSAIVAAHNMDMEAKGRADQVKFGGPASIQTLGSRRLSREFGDIIDSVNATRSEVMAIDRSWDVTANPMNRFCRSDQVNYVLHDVPVTYFSTGYAEDYHQVTDEPQYADYDHMARIGRFIHDVMMAIANRKDRPAIAGNDPNYPSCRRG